MFPEESSANAILFADLPEALVEEMLFPTSEHLASN
jgi:hypothetical protein